MTEENEVEQKVAKIAKGEERKKPKRKPAALCPKCRGVGSLPDKERGAVQCAACAGSGLKQDRELTRMNAKTTEQEK